MFHRILQYLFVCSIYYNTTPNSENYSTTYKTWEFQYAIEKIFSPGANLILDEILLRDFVCIKSKLIIVTKKYCHGIKIYVVKNSETAFVLKVIVYTGKYNYGNNYNKYMLKTVKFFCELVSHLNGRLKTFYLSLLQFHYFDERIRKNVTLCDWNSNYKYFQKR